MHVHASENRGKIGTGGDCGPYTAATANGLSATANGPALQVREPFVRLVSSGPPVPPRKPLTFDRPRRFAIHLRNDGNVAVPSSPPAGYSLAVTTDGTDAGTVYTTSVPGAVRLKPGQSRARRLTVTLPGEFAAGSYVLLVRLQVPLNETNGQTAATVPFSIA